jgi:DNA polymerase
VDRIAAIGGMAWEELEAAVAGCTACGLCQSRTQTVFGVGNREAPWMFIGEAPGAEEDARGEPFVGQAGRLLDNMLASIGRSRRVDADHPVFIANVLKCRPPGNRNPQPEEVAACEPFLLRQIELVRPRLLLVMGRFAAQSVLHTDAPISALRGRVHRLPVAGREVPAVVTYHPAYLLRNLADKAKAWADLCLALDVEAEALKER